MGYINGDDDNDDDDNDAATYFTWKKNVHRPRLSYVQCFIDTYKLILQN